MKQNLFHLLWEKPTKTFWTEKIERKKDFTKHDIKKERLPDLTNSAKKCLLKIGVKLERRRIHMIGDLRKGEKIKVTES